MPPPLQVPIVVFAGQSNANNTGSIGAIFDRIASNNGLLVQAARNGSPLASSASGPDWSAGPVTGELLGDLYGLLDALFDPTSATFIEGAYLDAVIWSQGGADIYNRNNANAYYDNLSALITALQNRYGAHDFVISGFADSSFIGRGLTGQLATNWQTVQDAQQALAALPYVQLINPDTVGPGKGYTAVQMYQWDYIHYNTTSGFSADLGAALVQMVLPMGQGGASYQRGDAGPNRFVAMTDGITQIYGGDGIDRLNLTASNTAVLLMDQGFSTSRLVDRAGNGTFHIDLIDVEVVQLTKNGDEARLGGAVTTLYTLGGADKVIGSDAAEVVFLGNGNDYTALLAGNDYLNGGNGRDTLLGGQGDDRLIGGSGDDVLNGGAGDDRLTGGRGADQFVFAPNQGRDTVTDFQLGWDHLVLERATWSDVTITAKGMDAEVRFQGTSVTVLNINPAQLDFDDFIFR